MTIEPIMNRSSSAGPLLLAAVLALSACSNSPPTAGGHFTIGGAVSGLIGGGLVLQNNGADDLGVAADGPFTFATKVADGAHYVVTVKTQPGSQTCAVNNGTGTMAGTNVAGVTVACSTNAYSVGGTASGHSGVGLVLQNSGADDLSVSANGAFAFATPVVDGATYAVTVKTQPIGVVCSVANGTGTVSGANVTSVAVACKLATGTFTKAFAPASAGSNQYLFYDGDVKNQSLYLASEINGAGDITTLRFEFNGPHAASTTCPNTTIKLGHTNLTALTTTFAGNVETGQGSLVTVLNNATVTIPAGAGSTWFDIPLTTPFHYNGVDNLVVQIDHPTACSTPVYTGYITSGTFRRALAFATDTTPGTAEYNATTANGADGVLPLMQFVFAGGDDLAYYGNTDSIGSPFISNASWRHVQMLHPAATLKGSGPITGIGMVLGTAFANPTTAETYTVTIKLGHSTLAALTNNFAGNFSGSPVTVASGLVFTVPANVPPGSTLWLPITGNLNYDGTDNLIVDIDVTAASAGSTIWMFGSAPSQFLQAASGAATGTVSNTGCATKFRFNGSTMDVMPGPATSGSSQVLGNSTSGRVESLYEPVYLGTGGTIDSIAVRLKTAPSAATLTNYKIYMGHGASPQFALTDTYAGSMANGGTLVYSGTLNVPGTLKAGDWFTIPLQTPFTYDPTQRLTVYFGTDQASAVTAEVAGQNDIQFSSRSMGAWSNGPYTDKPTWLWTGIVNVMLGITN